MEIYNGYNSAIGKLKAGVEKVERAEEANEERRCGEGIVDADAPLHHLSGKDKGKHHRSAGNGRGEAYQGGVAPQTKDAQYIFK